MKFSFFVSLFASFLFAGSALAADKTAHVVVISIDGFPAYLWHQPDLPIPNLR